MAVCYYQLLYLSWYLCSAHMVYAALTLNYPVVIFYTLIILAQTKVKRNQKYIDFLNNVLQIRRGLGGVDVIYEEDISE